MSCSRTTKSDADEARTRDPSVSSQALYHGATALPFFLCVNCTFIRITMLYYASISINGNNIFLSNGVNVYLQNFGQFSTLLGPISSGMNLLYI